MARDDGDDFDVTTGHRERMRARLARGGGEGFHDYELLEYLLSLATPRRDTKPLARRLIDEFGSLPSVLAATHSELERVPGLGETGIAAIKFSREVAIRSMQQSVLGRPVLSSWQAVIDYLTADMAHGLTERFRVLFLNSKNILIRDEVMQEGTVNQTAVYVREVIKRALELGATALVLVHNHPSGDPRPSRDDIDMTNDIVDAGRRLGVSVHDHLVIGATGHASFKTLGYLAER